MFFLFSALGFQPVNGREQAVGSLKRGEIQRQGVFSGMHVYILRALRVIQCNWRAIKLALRQTCGKCALRIGRQGPEHFSFWYSALAEKNKDAARMGHRNFTPSGEMQYGTSPPASRAVIFVCDQLLNGSQGCISTWGVGAGFQLDSPTRVFSLYSRRMDSTRSPMRLRYSAETKALFSYRRR